ncbi:MAG: hypothetical protein LQ351_004622 [Letrouitia transgressa]|nr:MAG: hypothetical protein LQ351_004622 [Letrouitia transgressa]
MAPSSPTNLFGLLQSAADTSGEIIIYQPQVTGKSNLVWTYRSLLQNAQEKAELLIQTKGIKEDTIILLHFDEHSHAIEWFWATIVAGFLPVISPPLVQDVNARRKHLIHLSKLLQRPVVLTTNKLLPEFLELEQLDIRTIQDLQPQSSSTCSGRGTGHTKMPDDRAVLMLTSGSTGNAKAVSLAHGQILAALDGKSKSLKTSQDDVMLNWIGLDHVANLTEAHLHAMRLGATQIHIQAADLLVDPLQFIRLIHKHRATFTFAPNFFLALLNKHLGKYDSEQNPENFNLSSLKTITSGGEAVVVETAVNLTEHLRRYGVGANVQVICPGFGMTETCAGSIYSKACPSYDLVRNHEFASLGSCIPGMQIRVRTDQGVNALPNEVGMLQACGPVVFSNYFNNALATKEAFTMDGWFITGDLALIDSDGNLNLTGRDKEGIIINGVKHYPHELETALEEAQIPGVTYSYTVVFPHRPKKSETEVLCVVYLPAYDLADSKARTETADAISKVSSMICGVKPHEIIPVEKSRFSKSSLGKISRMKVRGAFERGEYQDLQEANTRLIRQHRISLAQEARPSDETQEHILKMFAERFQLPADEIGIDSSLFDYGITSVDIISIKRQLEQQLNLDQEIPLIAMLNNPTIRGVAYAIGTFSASRNYNPVVALQTSGQKTPLWLVHPGVGEVLVFLNLSRYLTERPVYALRARGFNPGEKFFESIPEIVSTYKAAIKNVQPHGPYAIAGYSFGAMLAFEICKTLESEGEEVPFFGSFNLPPHIKSRMKQLDWTETILNLAYFLDLVPESYARERSVEMHTIGDRPAVLDQLMRDASTKRLQELGLDRDQLAHWASLGNKMQQAAVGYEPSGSVAAIDVFVAIPLAGIAKGKQDWRDKQLSVWRDFCRNEVKFHDVAGAHYTMLNPEHVQSFQKTLKNALKARGV